MILDERGWKPCKLCGERNVTYFRYTTSAATATETVCDTCAVVVRLAGESFGGNAVDWEPTRNWTWGIDGVYEKPTRIGHRTEWVARQARV